jgi:hypothetical protein
MANATPIRAAAHKSRSARTVATSADTGNNCACDNAGTPKAKTNAVRNPVSPFTHPTPFIEHLLVHLVDSSTRAAGILADGRAPQ